MRGSSGKQSLIPTSQREQLRLQKSLNWKRALKAQHILNLGILSMASYGTHDLVSSWIPVMMWRSLPYKGAHYSCFTVRIVRKFLDCDKSCIPVRSAHQLWLCPWWMRTGQERRKLTLLSANFASGLCPSQPFPGEQARANPLTVDGVVTFPSWDLSPFPQWPGFLTAHHLFLCYSFSWLFFFF